MDTKQKLEEHENRISAIENNHENRISSLEEHKEEQSDQISDIAKKVNWILISTIGGMFSIIVLLLEIVLD